MKALWVEPDIRDEIINFITLITKKTKLTVTHMLKMIEISSSKYYDWIKREGEPNHHNGKVPKQNWLLQWEIDAIVAYAGNHPGEGYRRLTYMMIDENEAFASPATVYRILKFFGLLNKWNRIKRQSKGTGFFQPTAPHQHWHTDIKFVNYRGTFLFLISVIDGYSRYIVHHELRQNMQTSDVELTVQKALEKFPANSPKLISDNGPQYISKDFGEYLKFVGLQHIRTSIAYPQSNGKIERYHRTINEECLKKSSLINLDDARKQINDYVEFYNTKRLHSSLFYLTPDDFLNDRVKERIADRDNKLLVAKKIRIAFRNAS